jgi:hypothetical protein
MPPQSTMHIYQGIALECQHCYMICRYTDAAVRRNCPACGLAIANWPALEAAVQAQTGPGEPGVMAAEPGTDTA